MLNCALMFPSLIESLGLPLIEANALSKPIIASNFQYVKDVCFPIKTFNPYSAESIAKAIIDFLSLKDLKHKTKINETVDFNKIFDE